MGYTMTAQQPYPDFNKEKITDQSENSVQQIYILKQRTEIPVTQ